MSVKKIAAHLVTKQQLMPDDVSVATGRVQSVPMRVLCVNDIKLGSDVR